MQILYDDNEVIVCIKPTGIQSQEDSSGKISMITELEKYTKTQIFPLSRLDRDVSGVMVFAKNKTSAAFLSKDISEHKMLKEYKALVFGKMENEKGEMIDLLFKDSRKNKSFVVKKMRKGVKEAILEYSVDKVLEIDNKEYSLVSVKLKTGRTHQIRVQFASRKHSLAGDRKYGGADNFKNICLYSYKIDFRHPKTKEIMTFSDENYDFSVK